MLLDASDEKNKKLSHDQQNSSSEVRIGKIVINRSHKVITINNTPIELTRKEFEIIDLLATSPNCEVTSEDIIANVWPQYNKATKEDVHQYVHLLRKKIEQDWKKPKLLVTLKGFGYKLCI